MTYTQMAKSGYSLSQVRRERIGCPRKAVKAMYDKARRRVRLSDERRVEAARSLARAEARIGSAFEGPIDSLRSSWGSRLPATAVSAASRIGLTGQTEKRRS